MKKIINADFCVCGGGLSGICAAVSAARQGKRVVLCNDRPTIGGNSSSEFRVWICGATGLGNNRYAEEGGIVGELVLENLYRNPQGNPQLWDMLLYDFIKREKNITLLQNARALSARCHAGQMESVTVYQNSTETEYEILAPFFADCTGDGCVAVSAGAQWVHGNEDEGAENREQFDMGQEKNSLGSTILFTTKKCDKPVPFIPFSFAYSKEEIEATIRRTGKVISLQDSGCDYWWIEYGGERNTIYDGEVIQTELYKIIYGIWDYIKNSGKFDAEYYTLEWVGMLPGRRESRRIISQYTLTLPDIVQQKEHWDTVAYGGWPVDLHPVGGFFDKRESCLQIPIGVYDIPLRSLICRDVKNLLLAGRDAGMTHGAMSSARVMKTCGLMGQGIGTAAAFAIEGKCDLSAPASDQIKDLQQQLLKDDIWFTHIQNLDPEDLARGAVVTASSQGDFKAGADAGWASLCKPACILLPPLPQGTSVYLMMQTPPVCKGEIEIYSSSCLQNHDLKTRVSAFPIPSGVNGWVKITAEWGPNNTILRLPACPEMMIRESKTELPGALGVWSADGRGLRMFRPAIYTTGFSPYHPQNVVDGYNRPLGHMHLWAAPLGGGEEFVELQLEQPEDIAEVHLYFESSLFRDFNNLRPGLQNVEWEKMPPNLARDFTVACIGEETVEVSVKENFKRHVVVYPQAKKVKKVRIAIQKSWGGMAAIYEVRLYKKLQKKGD